MKHLTEESKLQINIKFLQINHILLSYFEGLTLDIICSCCFGFSIDSISDPNNEIIKHLKALFLDSLTKDPRFMLIGKLI